MDEYLENLPDDFKSSVCASGIEMWHGYYKVFGTAGAYPYNLQDWNRDDVWRFAWPTLSKDYFVFGATAVGDFFAFDLKKRSSEVYFLDAYEMESGVVAATYTQFIDEMKLILKNGPVDDNFVDAYKSVGALNMTEGLAVIPPPLLVNEFSPKEWQKMDLLTVVLINGDIYQQCCESQAE